MSEINAAGNFDNHEHQERQDVVIVVDTAQDNKTEEQNKKLATENQNETPPIQEITTQPDHGEFDKNSNINKLELVNEKKRDNMNFANTDIYTRMRVYDTYYGQQQNTQQGQWFGGYGQNYGPEPFAYDPSTRNSFVKLVLIIVLIMLVITAAFVAFVLATNEAKQFFLTHGVLLMIMATILLLISVYAMYCSSCTRVPPCNFIFLILAVIAMSILATNVSVRYRTDIVLYATIATAAVIFICVLLACSSFDFTSWLLYVVVFATAFSVIVMIVFTTMLITGNVMRPVQIVILVVSTLIEVAMLTMELQMILGGRSVELTEEDYALGAFMVYTSIMNLFMKLVQLIGFADS